MKQRISEWWQMATQTRPTLAYVGLSVVIALVVMGIIVGIAIPGAKVDAMAYARQQAAQAMNNVTATRVQLQADYEVFQTTIQQGINDGLDGMSSLLNQTEADIATVTAALVAVQSDVAGLNEAALSSYLAGTFGNYTIHARSAGGGNFTANVHMLYVPGVGNETDYGAVLGFFTAGVNWSMESVPAYVCTPTFNGTSWALTEVWFNVGILQLQPGEEAVFPVSCIGLNETWQPTFAYVDMFRV
jgi:type II secretory pathway pseudopilin PulG